MDTNNMHQILLFVIGTLCGLGQFLDCQTTDVGLAHGFREANSLMGKLQGKIGSGGLFALKCMVLPAVGVVLFTTVGFGPSMAWLVPLTVIGFIAGIKNYLLLRKNKIAVF